MAWLSFGLLIVAAFVTIGQSRAVPVEPVAIVMGPNGAPVMMMRTKRQPAPSVPHRAMMFTGYYRPTRNSNDGPATGVFAQGNAVSGGSYMGDNEQTYLQPGPEPSDESEVTSSEAEAASSNEYDEEPNYSNTRDGEPQQDEIQPYGPEAPAADEPLAPQIPPTKRPIKSNKPKKQNKKTIVHVQEDEEADDDGDSDDEIPSQFAPFKGNNRGQMPALNNFFPIMFSIPSGYARRGSSSEGSPPGMITAIANSYSTGKSGIASSVATAYGGAPHGKKKNTKSSQ